MYIKGLFEVYKILGRIGIKPKDVIGMSGDIVKMGKSLFNTRINPKLVTFIEKNGKIPTKILDDIKLHARTLKNATENQKNLFQENIKQIVNAKELKNVQTTKGLGDLWPRQLQKIKEKVNKEFALKRFKEAAEKSQSPVTGVKQPATSVREQAFEAFKGWKPTVIKGGKDKLATGGIANHFRERQNYVVPGLVLGYEAIVALTAATGLGMEAVRRYSQANPDMAENLLNSIKTGASDLKDNISSFVDGVTQPKSKEMEEIEKSGQKETFPIQETESWIESYPDAKPEKIKAPDNIPPQIKTESEGFPIPEQKGWQEFILYNKAIEKKIKDNAPADKEKASDEYLDAVRELVELHDGNIEKALRSVKLNREYVRAKFYQRGQKLEGTGGQIIETIKPIENIELFTEYTNNLKKDSSLIDTIYNEGIKTKRLNKEDKYLNIQDIANAIGMDISTKGSKNQLLKLLEEDVRKTDEARSVAKKYHINDVIKKAKEWSSQKLMEGDEPSSSKRYKHVQKSDASLFTENNKVIRRIRELTQLDKTYLEDQIEDIGHPESVRTSEKYKDLLKNINTIQDYVFQDKDINRDVIQTQGHAGDMESIYKKLNKLLNKTNVNKELIKIQKEIDARLKKTKKQIRDHKEYTIGKNQDKRIARIEITLPQEGEAFTANNLGVDLSNVDKKWIMGKVDLINPEAKKFDDLNDNQKEIYRANLNDQYLEMIGKIYKEAGYGKGEILDIQETISEGTHSKKGVLEKARGGPILSGVDQYILDRYK